MNGTRRFWSGLVLNIFCYSIGVLIVTPSPAQPVCTITYGDSDIYGNYMLTHVDTSTGAENIKLLQERKIVEVEYENLSAIEIPPFILMLDTIERLSLTLRHIPSEQFSKLLTRSIVDLDVVVNELDSIAFRGRTGIQSIYLKSTSLRYLDLSMVVGLSSLGLYGCTSLERLRVGHSVQSLDIIASGRDTLCQIYVRSQTPIRYLELVLLEYKGSIYIEGPQTEIGMLKTDMASWKNLCTQTNKRNAVLNVLSLTLLSPNEGCLPDIVGDVEGFGGTNCRYDRLLIEVNK